MKIGRQKVYANIDYRLCTKIFASFLQPVILSLLSLFFLGHHFSPFVLQSHKNLLGISKTPRYTNPLSVKTAHTQNQIIISINAHVNTTLLHNNALNPLPPLPNAILAPPNSLTTPPPGGFHR